MSVLIKNMEMPKSCRDCGIEQEGFWCGAQDGYQNTRCFTSERREDCPLISVPTPHGRLIDADALKATIFPEQIDGMKTSITVSCVHLVIDDAPTIIESEEN